MARYGGNLYPFVMAVTEGTVTFGLGEIISSLLRVGSLDSLSLCCHVAVSDSLLILQLLLVVLVVVVVVVVVDSVVVAAADDDDNVLDLLLLLVSSNCLSCDV